MWDSSSLREADGLGDVRGECLLVQARDSLLGEDIFSGLNFHLPYFCRPLECSKELAQKHSLRNGNSWVDLSLHLGRPARVSAQLITPAPLPPFGWSSPGCGRHNNVQIRRPGMCEYVVLLGKGCLGQQMEFRLSVSWPSDGDITPDNLRVPRSSRGSLCAEEKGVIVRGMGCKDSAAVAGFEDGGRGQRPRNVGSF